jgi:hypothetical protein
LRYLSMEVLPKGMPPPCEHVVVDTAQGEDIHHAGGASVTCARNITNTAGTYRNSRGSYDAFKREQLWILWHKVKARKDEVPWTLDSILLVHSKYWGYP